MKSNQYWQNILKPEERRAVCFELKTELKLTNGEHINLTEQGFLICYQGQLRAWKNSCPHAGAPMDWVPGQFFSEDGNQLVCHVHGAHFDPLTGECLSGPCSRGLYPVEFTESGDSVQVPVHAATLDPENNSE